MFFRSSRSSRFFAVYLVRELVDPCYIPSTSYEKKTKNILRNKIWAKTGKNDQSGGAAVTVIVTGYWPHSTPHFSDFSSPTVMRGSLVAVLSLFLALRNLFYAY